MVGLREASLQLFKSLQSFGRLMRWVSFASLSEERSVSALPPSFPYELEVGLGSFEEFTVSSSHGVMA